MTHRALIAVALALLLAGWAAPPSAATGGHAGHDMSAMPGMTAEEHAQMAAPAAHEEPAKSGERPVALVVGGFVLVNAALLAAAAALRRRPASVKRRAALARVRGLS